MLPLSFAIVIKDQLAQIGLHAVKQSQLEVGQTGPTRPKLDKTGPKRPKRDLTGPKEAKWDKTGENKLKHGQMGLNRAMPLFKISCQNKKFLVTEEISWHKKKFLVTERNFLS